MKSLFFTVTTTILLYLFLGTSGLAAQEDLRVFPNPVTTQFEIGHSERVNTIRVINMVGREVRSFSYTPGQPYSIADLPQGMYLVQLQDKGDKVIHTQRIKKN